MPIRLCQLSANHFSHDSHPNSPSQDNLVKVALEVGGANLIRVNFSKVLTALDLPTETNQAPGTTNGCPIERLTCSSVHIVSHLTALFNSCLSTSYFRRITNGALPRWYTTTSRNVTIWAVIVFKQPLRVVECLWAYSTLQTKKK